MTVTPQRTAVPGLTPVHAVLSHEARITQLEQQNAELRQTVTRLTAVLSELNCRTYRTQNELRVTTAVDLAHHARLTRLEGVTQGDLRLSEVLSGIEARLARIELGGEALVP